MNFRGLIGVSILAQASLCHAGDAITVYSQYQAGRSTQQSANGIAIVSHDREYDIAKGVSELRVTDVAARIDPTTVSFQSLDREEVRVLEQRYEFDLVNQRKLMRRFVGETIEVELAQGDGTQVISGVLLSSDDGLMLQHEDGQISSLSQWRNVRFPALPDGLITKPTLVWRLHSEQAGKQQTRTSYQTGGMAWWADYNVLLNEQDQCQANINAWVSLQNQSGTGFDQANLKLVAGDVNRVQPEPQIQYRTQVLADAVPESAAAGFSEKSFFEYHLYTLGRSIDLPNNSTTQVELFPAVQAVPCEKELVVDGSKQWRYRGGVNTDSGYHGNSSMDVAVYLRFKNDEDSGLGIPLPEGRIRISQVDDADGRVEFIGEDSIAHTPKDEEVMVKVGNAFDVVGERKRSDFKIDHNNHRMWDSYEVTLRNQKDEAVDVVVLESLYRASNWTIENNNAPFEKLNANRIRFNVSIPANGEKVVRYTAYYTW
jgi:hypothetical protein